MTRFTTLDLPSLSRASVGFDNMFADMERVFENSKTTSYPPYNIIKIDENNFMIEIAVAGFDRDDFDIELHKGILTVRANIGETDSGTEYLHKGIAARNFERKFHLADHVEVQSVNLKQGMLSIRLENIVPAELQPKKIAITHQDS